MAYRWTLVGVLLTAAGLVAIVIAWGATAGEDHAALQLPYVASAGFSGLALVAMGVTVVNVAAKRADAEERSRQQAELRSLLNELRHLVGDADR